MSIPKSHIFFEAISVANFIKEKYAINFDLIDWYINYNDCCNNTLEFIIAENLIHDIKEEGGPQEALEFFTALGHEFPEGLYVHIWW